MQRRVCIFCTRATMHTCCSSKLWGDGAGTKAGSIVGNMGGGGMYAGGTLAKK